MQSLQFVMENRLSDLPGLLCSELLLSYSQCPTIFAQTHLSGKTHGRGIGKVGLFVPWFVFCFSPKARHRLSV